MSANSSEPKSSDIHTDSAAIETSEAIPLHTEAEKWRAGSEPTPAQIDQVRDADESASPEHVPRTLDTECTDDEPWPEEPEGGDRAPTTYPSGIKNVGGSTGPKATKIKK